MSFNIRRLEGCFEGVSQKYFKNFFLARSMDSRMDLMSLPSRRAISRRDTPSASISSLRLFDPLVFKLPEKFCLRRTAVRIIRAFIFRRIQGIAMVPLLPILIAFLPPGIQNQVSDFLIDLYI